MANPQLLDYIQKSLANGVSESQIRSVLLRQGWKNNEINQAFSMDNEQQSIPPLIPTAPSKKFAAKILIALVIVLVLGGASYFIFSFSQNQVRDKTFKNGSETLKKLATSYGDIKSFEFQGTMEIKVKEEDAKSTFHGAVVLPHTIQITQNTDNLSRYNDPEYKTPQIRNYHRDTIATDNKILEKLSKESDWRFSGFIINPTEKISKEKIPNYQSQSLLNISWLVFDYADNLEYVGIEDSLYHYKILPKNYKFGPASDSIRNFRITPGISAFDANLVNTTISGEVWVNKNYRITKEKYNIPAPNGGIDIKISYANYGKNISIKAPIDTSALDEIYKQIEAGKNPAQAEKE